MNSSVAGTVTARILADHFERVILVDPEIDDAKPKTRILQYHALHGEPTEYLPANNLTSSL
jgi:hypothetical protein